MEKMECMICGNTNKEELELQTLFSDNDGNDVEVLEYLCKEGQGCSE